MFGECRTSGPQRSHKHKDPTFWLCVLSPRLGLDLSTSFDQLQASTIFSLRDGYSSSFQSGQRLKERRTKPQKNKAQRLQNQVEIQTLIWRTHGVFAVAYFGLDLSLLMASVKGPVVQLSEPRNGGPKLRRWNPWVWTRAPTLQLARRRAAAHQSLIGGGLKSVFQSFRRPACSGHDAPGG